jgi:hypothetical protein
VLRNYLPVFLYTYCFILIMVPAVYAAGCYTRTALIPRVLMLQLDGVMRPQNAGEVRFRSLLKADAIVALQIQHLVVLVTFGLACPALAVICCAAICSTTATHQFIIVRYTGFLHASAAAPGHDSALLDKLCASDAPSDAACPPAEEEEGGPGHASEKWVQLDQEIGSAWRGLRESTFVVLAVAALFDAFIIFDMTADAAAYDLSFGLFLFCCVLPVGLWLYYRGLLRDPVPSLTSTNASP